MTPITSSVLSMRRRSVWEAADSGLLLWRENFIYFIPLFALPVWIAASALMFIPENFRWVSWIVLWWLKPFFDRLVLHIAANRFFRDSAEENYHAENTYRMGKNFRGVLRGLGHDMFRGLAGDLLWRRFSPFRSGTMCLRLLERPNKKQYGGRKKVLASGGLDFCALLTCLGPLMELMLLGGELVFALIILELVLPNESWNLTGYMMDTSLFVYAAYCFNYIIAESLYVCMGFGIYINSRTEVEGWDIQLLFQKFTAKLIPAVKILILVCGLVFFSLPLKADEAPQEPGDTVEFINPEDDEILYCFPPDFLSMDSIPHGELEEILASEDFGGTRPGWTVRPRNWGDNDPQIRMEMDLSPWLKQLKEILAIFLRTIIILAVLGFLIFALLRLKSLRRRGSLAKHDNDRVYAHPLNSAEDPETFFYRAEDFFSRGLVREAWASCLCGTISAFGRYLNLSFPPDATEYDCLELVRSRFRTEADIFRTIVSDFGDLVGNWVLLAYGHRNPQEGSFEKALVFGRSLEAGTGPAELPHA